MARAGGGEVRDADEGTRVGGSGIVAPGEAEEKTSWKSRRHCDAGFGLDCEGVGVERKFVAIGSWRHLMPSVECDRNTPLSAAVGGWGLRDFSPPSSAPERLHLERIIITWYLLISQKFT